MNAPTNSPWGRPCETTLVAPGIWIVQTAGQSGYYLEPRQNRAVLEDWQVATFANLGLAGWYRCDRDWCMVALTFPCSFSREQRVLAKRTFAAWIEPKLAAAA